MKRYSFKTWQLASLFLLCALLPISLITAFAQNTETCKGSHLTRKDFYKNVRTLQPATITEVNGNRINYAIVEEGIELGSLELEPNWSIVPKDFNPANLAGCYGITYCEKHLTALVIERIDSKQCQALK